jgi:ribosomal protein L16 Arg81 hydroxylase
VTGANLFANMFERWSTHEGLFATLGETMLTGAGPRQLTSNLIDWAALDDLILWHRLIPPDIQVVNNGRTVPAAQYLATGPSPRRRSRPVVDPDALGRILAAGATLVVNDLDEMSSSVAEATHQLQQLVKERVQVNAYATWGRSAGFNAHWDDHDVVVLQVEGSKHWDVFGPGIPYAVDHELNPDNQRPEATAWSGDLSPGDGLYLPRGWWHSVQGVGDVSLHLTFGFQRRTGLHYARWLADQLPSVEAFRRDLRRYEKADDVLVKTLFDVANGADIPEYLEAFEESLETPRRLNLGGLATRSRDSANT